MLISSVMLHQELNSKAHLARSTSAFLTENGRGFGIKPAGGARGSVLGMGMNPGGLARGFCLGGTGLAFLAGMNPGAGVNRFCFGAGMKPGGGANGSAFGAGGLTVFDCGATAAGSSVICTAGISSSSSGPSLVSSCFASSFASSLRSWVRVRGRCSLVLPLPIRLVRPTEISSLSSAEVLVLLAATVAASDTGWLCCSVAAGITRRTTLLTTLTTFLPLELCASLGVSPISALNSDDSGILSVSNPGFVTPWSGLGSASDWIGTVSSISATYFLCFASKTVCFHFNAMWALGCFSDHNEVFCKGIMWIISKHTSDKKNTHIWLVFNFNLKKRNQKIKLYIQTKVFSVRMITENKL